MAHHTTVRSGCDYLALRNLRLALMGCPWHAYNIKANRLVPLGVLLWVLCFTASLVHPYFTEATGDGFTRGLNRLGLFFLWQIAAATVALVVFVAGLSLRSSTGGRHWPSKFPILIQGSIVLFFAAVVAYLNFSVPPPEAYEPPEDTVTKPAAVAVNPEPVLVQKEFRGIYRGGFEMSHFYTSRGEGPWWLEAEGRDWESIQSYSSEGPGRSGVVTVALSFVGWTEPADGGFKHLGVENKKVVVRSLRSIRPLSEEEFEQLRVAFQRFPKE